MCNKCKSSSNCNSNKDAAEINFSKNVIQFFKFKNESPLKTLTRMSKAFNPKQMFFPIKFNKNLNAYVPGLNKIEWLYENHSDNNVNRKTNESINYELLYFLSQKSINYSPKSFTTQIAHNQYRDIHTLDQLSANISSVNGTVADSSTAQSASMNKTKSSKTLNSMNKNEIGSNLNNGCNSSNTCFVCQK